LRVSRAPVINTLSLHDALPIYLVLDALGQLDQELLGDVLPGPRGLARHPLDVAGVGTLFDLPHHPAPVTVVRAELLLEGDEAERSEEHTSELQSREKLVCRLLL